MNLFFSLAYDSSIGELQENSASLLGTFLEILEKIEQKPDRNDFDLFVAQQFIENLAKLIQKDFDQSFNILLKRNNEYFVTPAIQKCLSYLIKEKDVLLKVIRNLTDAMIDPEKCKLLFFF